MSSPTRGVHHLALTTEDMKLTTETLPGVNDAWLKKHKML